MAEHGLWPGYVKLDYHSAYGKHVMLLPTRAWNLANVTGVMGSYASWAGAGVDAEAMIDAFIAAIKASFLASTEFDIATIYTIDTPGDPAIPRRTKATAVAGTNVLTTQAKAAQSTWTLRDVDFNLAKLVFLDSPVNTGFEPTSSLGAGSAQETIFNTYASDSWAWSSRAGRQITMFQKISYDLSDKLRREYGMV